jgi:hypothetical protein
MIIEFLGKFHRWEEWVPDTRIKTINDESKALKQSLVEQARAKKAEAAAALKRKCLIVVLTLIGLVG